MGKYPFVFRSSKAIRTNLFSLIFSLILCISAFMPCCSPLHSRTDKVENNYTPQSSSTSLWGRDLKLDEATARLVNTLVEQGKLKGHPVLISPHDLYDVQTGLSLPLATLLRSKLITEMKKQDVRVLLPGADDERFMILQGTWQKQGEDLGIDLKVMKLGPDGPEAVASASEKVSIKNIDPSALTPNRESWARYLVRELELNTSSRGNRKVHMRDFKIKSKKCNTELGPYLTGWMRPALAQSRMFVPLDQQAELRGIPVKTSRTRETRAIPPNLLETEPGTGLMADLMKADGEIKGVAWLHEKKVEVQVRVVDRHGQQITAASADVPSEFFPAELFRPGAMLPTKAFTNSFGMEFVLIPSGTFMMGSGINASELKNRYRGKEEWYKDEYPQHRVTISKPYYLQTTEVSVGQWRSFVKDTSYKTDAERGGGSYVWSGKKWEKRAGRYWDNPGFLQTDSHPVTCVSWNDVQAYIRWINHKEGKDYRLPTEAEWEYACRAGLKTIRYWGDDPNDACSYANVADRSTRKKFSGWAVHECDDGFVYTAPVGNFQPNDFGLYDMLGNVWEWCQDWYGSYPSGSVTDPEGPSSGYRRVGRGGSWTVSAGSCRSARRLRSRPVIGIYFLGFRLAQSVK